LTLVDADDWRDRTGLIFGSCGLQRGVIIEIMSDVDQPNSESIDQPVAESEAPAVAELQEQLAQTQAQATEYLDQARRAMAELSNARRRMQREMDEVRASAAERILERLLPVIDDVERAFANVPADQVDSDWVNGFRMIQRKLASLLESEGVSLIPAEGQPFDPSIHYAVTHEEAEDFDDGQIIAQVAAGYRLNDKVLRPAWVRVAKGA
jgi:molecular chaperone GrpE